MMQGAGDRRRRKDSSFHPPPLAQCPESLHHQASQGSTQRAAADLLPDLRPNVTFPAPAGKIRGFAEQGKRNALPPAATLLAEENVAQPVAPSLGLMVQH